MNKQLLSAAILAVGIALAGLFVYCGIRHSADSDRAVTVKGLSTRDVRADHVVWPLSFSVQGNDLPSLYRQLAEVNQTLRSFLMQKGFQDSDFSTGNVSVDDNWASYYNHRPEFHYTISSSLVVSTDKVDLVVENNGCQSELLERGLVINSSEWNLDYQFNGLPGLKPEMIEEATKNARAVAQKFADDASCRLGTIRRASQGQFSVEQSPVER